MRNVVQKVSVCSSIPNLYLTGVYMIFEFIFGNDVQIKRYRIFTFLLQMELDLQISGRNSHYI